MNRELPVAVLITSNVSAWQQAARRGRAHSTIAAVAAAARGLGGNLRGCIVSWRFLRVVLEAVIVREGEIVWTLPGGCS